MPLTRCIECNRSISDSVYKCPGCDTHEPFGVVCELCGERLRRSEGVTSVRREVEIHFYSDFSDYSGHWYGCGEVDREIVAHKDCLERYYTPPATLECSECGLQVASSDLGVTALNLWSARRFIYGYGLNAELAVAVPGGSCPSCGNIRAFLDSVKCEWEPKASSFPKAEIVELRPPLNRESGEHYPCLKPLYSFQVGPNGQGHGHEKEKRAKAEAEDRRRKEQATLQEKAREEGIKTERGCGMMIGGILGFIVGFFMNCDVRHIHPIGIGGWFRTLLLGIIISVVIGAVIGAVSGQAVGTNKYDEIQPKPR
jgi:hypothetical protein